MKIEYTTIPNVVLETIDQAKQVLADSIIQNVYPLFDEVYKSKVAETKKIKKILKEKKNEVVQQKNNLQNLMNKYRKQKKIAKLLNRIEKMITSGLVYDGTLKHETSILLKIIPKLEDEKLDYHLRKTLQTINKRFSR